MVLLSDERYEMKKLISMIMVTALSQNLILAEAQSQNSVPSVSDVTITQLAYSRNVEITYKLSESPAIITLSIETNNVAIPNSAVTHLSGDVSMVVEPGGGNKTITWNAGADWPDNITDKAVARITAWYTNNPPAVMVVDLSKGVAGSSQNRYPVLYYPSLESLRGGITNEIYKSNFLVLKKSLTALF